jgi:hypothetical protein
MLTETTRRRVPQIDKVLPMMTFGAAAWNAPVLQSVQRVVDKTEHVQVTERGLEATATWMAWEQFATVRPPVADPSLIDAAIDTTLITTAINFAFTDFETRIPFTLEHDGRVLVDADAMFLRFDQALAAGDNLLDGARLRAITVDEVARMFDGRSPMPLLEERTRVWNEIGDRLVADYNGHFHEFVHSCPPVCWASGNGLVERLVAEFPHFNDSSVLYNVPIKFYKLAQLGVSTLHRLGLVAIKDIDSLSAFADYIVPAALRAMGVLVYSEPLANAVDTWQLIPRESIWENEIRVQTLYATAMLTDALNRIRPAEHRLTVAQLDYRLWSAFHGLIRPHHLTRTTMY